MANTNTNTTVKTEEAMAEAAAKGMIDNLTPDQIMQIAKAAAGVSDQPSANEEPGAFFAGIKYTANQLGDTGLKLRDGRTYTVNEICEGIALASELAKNGGIPKDESGKGWQDWPLWKKILVGVGVAGGVGFAGYLVYNKFFSSNSSETYVDVDGTEYDIVDA